MSNAGPTASSTVRATVVLRRTGSAGSHASRTRVRIVHVSDTLDKDYPLPHGDVLVHSGSMTTSGTAEELERFRDALTRAPHPYKVVICGARERGLDRKRPADVATLLTGAAPNTFLLMDSSVTILGVKFYGTPWNTSTRAFAMSHDACGIQYRRMPTGVDVLVSHQPPEGCLDLVYRPGAYQVPGSNGFQTGPAADDGSVADGAAIRRKGSSTAAGTTSSPAAPTVAAATPLGPTDGVAAAPGGTAHPGGRRSGSAALASLVHDRHIPVHLFGRAHHSAGVVQTQRTIFSNASMEVRGEPNVIDVVIETVPPPAGPQPQLEMPGTPIPPVRSPSATHGMLGMSPVVAGSPFLAPAGGAVPLLGATPTMPAPAVQLLPSASSQQGPGYPSSTAHSAPFQQQQQQPHPHPLVPLLPWAETLPPQQQQQQQPPQTLPGSAQPFAPQVVQMGGSTSSAMNGCSPTVGTPVVSTPRQQSTISNTSMPPSYAPVLMQSPSHHPHNPTAAAQQLPLGLVPQPAPFAAPFPPPPVFAVDPGAPPGQPPQHPFVLLPRPAPPPPPPPDMLPHATMLYPQPHLYGGPRHAAAAAAHASLSANAQAHAAQAKLEAAQVHAANATAHAYHTTADPVAHANAHVAQAHAQVAQYEADSAHAQAVQAQATAVHAHAHAEACEQAELYQQQQQQPPQEHQQQLLPQHSHQPHLQPPTNTTTTTTGVVPAGEIHEQQQPQQQQSVPAYAPVHQSMLQQQQQQQQPPPPQHQPPPPMFAPTSSGDAQYSAHSPVTIMGVGGGMPVGSPMVPPHSGGMLLMQQSSHVVPASSSSNSGGGGGGGGGVVHPSQQQQPNNAYPPAALYGVQHGDPQGAPQ